MRVLSGSGRAGLQCHPCLALLCCCPVPCTGMVDLKGKVALVTGATSGIGQVTAEYLAGATCSCYT